MEKVRFYESFDCKNIHYIKARLRIELDILNLYSMTYMNISDYRLLIPGYRDLLICVDTCINFTISGNPISKILDTRTEYNKLHNQQYLHGAKVSQKFENVTAELRPGFEELLKLDPDNLYEF